MEHILLYAIVPIIVVMLAGYISGKKGIFTNDNAKAFNMIVLGGLLKIKPMVTLDSVLRGLKKTLPERHHHLIPMNEEAIKKGMELIQEMK